MLPYYSIQRLYIVGVISLSFSLVAGDRAIYSFDDSGGLGRHFDGIGGLSGGGATSKLLVNYPEEQRNQILDFLFKPNFGASLQILKVEIGGDSQSTDGTEASHMHYSWDENYERGYEWWLMVEAKKRNPDIKLYGLPWAFPGWIGDGTRNPYTNPQLTATYIIKWIQGAKKYYNLTIDYIGIWNEKFYDVTYIIVLRRMLDSNGLNHVRIVAADASWSVANDMLKNSTFNASIDYIGTHYPITLTTPAALSTGKPLWASEESVSYNNNYGAGCWGREINENYVNGFMTSSIAWNLIASYYEGLPLYRFGLMTAAQPWSGNYEVESPIWMSAHTTQFTEIGWTYLRHGAGVGKLDEGGSYVALVSPDGKDLTIIIETFTQEHAQCESLGHFTVNPQEILISLEGSFKGISQLNTWYSKPSYNSDPDIFFIKQKPLELSNGQGNLDLGVDEVWTLTTLTTGMKGTYGTPPPPGAFPLPYTDDFESYAPGTEPYNIVPQTGSFETVTSPESNILQQTVIQDPIHWCPINLDFPVAVVGNYSWNDIYFEIDVRIGNINNTDGAFIATRVNKFGCDTFFAEGVYFLIFPSTNTIKLSNDLAMTQIVFTGYFSDFQEWNTVSLATQGEQATAMINGQIVLKHNLTSNSKQGFVGFGTSSYGLAEFDNLKIMGVNEGLARMDKLAEQYDKRLLFKPEV